MDNDNERLRQLRHIINQMQGVKRPLKDSHLMADRILRLVDKDIKAMCPDNAEQIFAMMDIADGILNFLVSYLQDLLDKAIKANLYNLKGLEGALYDAEDMKTRLIDLRLDIINWVKWFEVPDPPMPTPEEEAAAEAEKAEAYRTHGANLVGERPASDDE